MARPCATRLIVSKSRKRWSAGSATPECKDPGKRPVLDTWTKYCRLPHGQVMTHRPFTAPEATEAARSTSDAVFTLARLLVRQAAREAFGVNKPNRETDTVVRHHNHLMHVVMQGECHIVERFQILVQGRDGKNVGSILQIGRQTKICCVKADGRSQPKRITVCIIGPIISNQPLAWAERLNQPFGFIAFLDWCQVFLALPPRQDLRTAGRMVGRQYPDRGVHHRLPRKKLFVRKACKNEGKRPV